MKILREVCREGWHFEQRARDNGLCNKYFYLYVSNSRAFVNLMSYHSNM